ncbi:hypothetical protein [Flavobacterium sp. C4GT6]|uniref:hypothetical protein n=1 Tax=Flavobacterium sp. C4GT6 TaxID=3103818 RepID=UPI002ED3D67C
MWFRKKHKDPVNPLSYHESGFNLNDQHIKWNEIRKVTAYKEDLITVDCIHVNIEMENNIAFTLHEDLSIYNEFMKKLQDNVQISLAWFQNVAFPAFGRNEAVIYDKSKISFSQ